MFQPPNKRIAVVGSGIAGLSAAWRLSEQYDVTLFEAGSCLGGHANTVTIELGAQRVDVDTGFIVYNPKNYPNFTAMLDRLGVETAESDMSFAASINDGRFEYSSNPSGLFAQKRNWLRPRMWRMIRDILRLYDHARGAEPLAEELTLDEFLRQHGYSAAFRDDHILPMCAAIWSSPVDQMRAYPARSFFDFFRNHGLLQLKDRPEWRTVRGGSRQYVERLAEAFRGEVRLATPVRKIERSPDRVRIQTEQGQEMFDEVVLACHSDQALALLSDRDTEETALLGAIRYQPNTAVLHTDTRLLPRRRRAWASWNYLETRDRGGQSRISLTYWMNSLQPLPTETPVMVTLNPEIEPDSAKVLHTDTYSHPVFDSAAVAAQACFHRLQGRNRTWYCGAWLGSGFHEDGLQSGLAVAEALGAPVRPWSLDGATDRIIWPDHLSHRTLADDLVPTIAVAAE